MSGQGPAPVPGHNMPVLDVAAAEQFMDSCQQQGLQIPAAIRSALRTAAEASQKAQSHTKHTSHRLPQGVRSKQRKVAFSDEVVEISDEEASFSPHPAQLRLDVLIPGPKEAFYTMRHTCHSLPHGARRKHLTVAFSDEVVEISDEEATISPQKARLRLDDLIPGPKIACYTQRQRRNHRRAVLWRLLRTAPWRSVREHGGLRRNNDPSASLTSEPTAVLMAASTEPGSAFLCHNARPLNSSALQTEKEQGYNASKYTLIYYNILYYDIILYNIIQYNII